MQDNMIWVSKKVINLTYNKVTDKLSGDATFEVNPADVSFTTIDSSILPFDFTENLPGLFVIENFTAPTIDNGLYRYIAILSLADETYLPATLKINITVVSDEEAPPPEPSPSERVYNLRYWLEYGEHRLELLKRDYEGEITEISGNVRHSYQSKTDPFEPIVASSLSIKLDASTELTLNDLYSEDEQMYKVLFYKGGVLLFVGFLKPDGIYEDWVSDRWQLDIDALDGLSTLKTLSFVDDSGNSFQGKLSLLTIVTACLNRVGLNLPVNVCIDLKYDGMSGGDVLNSVIANTERYRQKESSTDVMDCEDVLKSILRIFNATVIQMHGEWWVYRALDVKENMVFLRHCENCQVTTHAINPFVNIGSHCNGAAIFHSGENQRKTISPSVQAYRIYYKYGLAEDVIRNGKLLMGSGINSDGWVINNVEREGFQRDTRRNDSGFGFYIEGFKGDVNQNTGASDDILNWRQLMHLNQAVEFTENDSLYFETNFTIQANRTPLYIRVYISSPNYYLIDGDGWVPKSGNSRRPAGSISMSQHNGGAQWHATTPPAPESGAVEFSIDVAGGNYLNAERYWRIGLDSVAIKPSTMNLKGIYYTGQRSSRVSTVTKENVTVYNGDSLSNIYVGTLYTADGKSTELWQRVGDAEKKNLLTLNVEDNLSVAQRPMIVFEGDIYGHIPYLSGITIDNINGNFQPFDYSYDMQDNVVRLVSREIEYSLLAPETYNIEIETDNGAETKVTIKS